MKRKSGDGANRVFMPFNSPIDVDEARLAIIRPSPVPSRGALYLEMITSRR